MKAVTTRFLLYFYKFPVERLNKTDAVLDN
jgi:hypothetical protein